MTAPVGMMMLKSPLPVLLCWLGSLHAALARPVPKCAVVSVSGQSADGAQGGCMGSYVLQDALHDQRPVYRSRNHYLYHVGGTGTAAKWQISGSIGARGASVLLSARSKAWTVDAIKASWRVRGGGGDGGSDGSSGGMLSSPAVKVQCRAQCKIVSIRGERDGDPQANAMGDYVIQARLNDGRPVYKFMDDTYGARFLFYSARYKSWSIGHKLGGDQFEMFVSSTAFTPDQITGKWKVSSKGSFVQRDAVGSECAASCTKVRITGLREGEPNSDCMGYYVQQPSMNDNKPVYKLADGNKFLYYSPFYENWNIGSAIGAAKFDLFVTSTAKTADAIRGVWKVQTHGKFVAHHEVRTSCAEDPCAAFSMAMTCTAHFSESGCGWCHSTQRCASKKYCKVGWSRHAKLTKVITDKQSSASMFGDDSSDVVGGEGSVTAQHRLSRRTVVIVSSIAGVIVLFSWCVMLRSEGPRTPGYDYTYTAGGSAAVGGSAAGAAGGAGLYQAAGVSANAGGKGGDVIEVSSLLA